MNETQKEHLLKSIWCAACALGPEVAPDKPETEQKGRAMAFILARLLKSPRLVRGIASWAVDLLEAQDNPEGVPS